MNERYDLHCHSSASDGALSPTELLDRAHRQGVTRLALTDHDTTAGLAEAQTAANAVGITLIPGIELSVTWENYCFHIVGLNLNPQYPPLLEGCRKIQDIRRERAEKIAYKLDKQRIPGALEAVKQAVGAGMVTRTHFADFLLAHHHVSTPQEAFDRYLGQGKSAYVATNWVSLEDALEWITGAGGIAVLAHPARYNLTASKMRRFLSSFKALGGQGLEVVYGRNNADDIDSASHYARAFDLAGSVGSDFHNPKNQWVELGRLNPLPTRIMPVWQFFQNPADSA
ncbi:MAG: phosphatase [Gammaproteobacteria bacterium HGW-Gammaproteobacteria-3]|nr:MAG: phosphatase [Gammaproteobacteria bacterium HGW-Gammaproteobacteria-3]